MLDFFKVLFQSKGKSSKELADEENDEDQIESLRVISEMMDLTEDQQKIVSKNLTNFKKEQPKRIKGENMSALYLVTLDATNREEVKSLPKSLNNFYIVHANNESGAVDMVLSTFPQHIGSQIQYALKATNLSFITKLLQTHGKIWSYIPFRGQNLPGQQALIKKPEQLLSKDEFGYETAKVQASTTVGEALDGSLALDIDPEKDEEIAKVTGKNKPEGVDKQEMMRMMMEMMPQMMAVMASQQPKTKARKSRKSNENAGED
jgi:hypothetical protein